jgi:hypothetical protein
MSSVLALSYARDQLHGWCAACRGAGQLVPAVDAGLQACQAHLRLLPRRPVSAGQLVLDVAVEAMPPALRARYVTGEQQQCTDCVAAGVPRPRQGLSGRTPGDPTPLCLPCWRSRADHAGLEEPARRDLSAVEEGWLAELAEQLACDVCGPRRSSALDKDLLPPGAVEAKRRRRRLDRARGQQARPRRRTGCWRCADAPWLQAARAVHEADQAAAAADAARVDELQAGHRAALERLARTQRRLQTVVTWRGRVARVVEAIPQLVKTGSRGRLQVRSGAGGWSRAWALTAEFLARDAAERQTRGLSARGRPSQVPHVVAAMAVAASYESGRESMAGLDWTATYAGVAPRTVTTGWARTVELGCTVRTEKGRILTVEERRELKRHRQRAVYDFTPLHLSPTDRQPYLGAAALVLAQLLERATQLVDEHQAIVDDAVAEAAAVQAELLDTQAWTAEQVARDLALQAEVDPDWAEDAEQAARAAHKARARATRAAHPPVDVAARTTAVRAERAAWAATAQAVDNAYEQSRRMANFCDHPRRGSGKKSSSGYLFWGLPSDRPTSPLSGRQRPNGRGEGQQLIGASRSTTTQRPQLTASTRPRTRQGVRYVSPARLRRSEITYWTKPLARALAGRWEFLGRYLDDADDGRRSGRAVARERGLRETKIATTLGARLAPDWTAGDIVRLVERFAGIRSIIAPGDAHSPLRYLAAMLDTALTNPAAEVPCYSPVREAFEREVLAGELAAEHAADSARSTGLRAEMDARDAAAEMARSGAQAGLTAVHIELARIAASRADSTPRSSRHLGLAIPRTPTDPELSPYPGGAVGSAATWPAPRKAGAGLPEGWRHGDS